MFAVQFDRFGPPEVLRLGTAPEPHAGPGQVRIRVYAAGVSPVDVALRAGTSPPATGSHCRTSPGVDAAGIVDEVGDGAAAVMGDAVFGAVPLAGLGGASAEFAVLAFWTGKPDALSWTEAGAAGTSVETATPALDRLGVEAGTTLLIDGAAGGVGTVAVQLAVARGARVIGTARADNHPFLAALGAEPVQALPAHADRALDVAGAGRLGDLVALTGSPVAVLSLVDFTAPRIGVPLSMGEMAGEPDGWHGLAHAAALAEAGRFRVPIEAAFPMADAADAHARAEQRPRRGKLALTAPML